MHRMAREGIGPQQRIAVGRVPRQRRVATQKAIQAGVPPAGGLSRQLCGRWRSLALKRIENAYRLSLWRRHEKILSDPTRIGCSDHICCHLVRALVRKDGAVSE